MRPLRYCFCCFAFNNFGRKHFYGCDLLIIKKREKIFCARAAKIAQWDVDGSKRGCNKLGEGQVTETTYFHSVWYVPALFAQSQQYAKSGFVVCAEDGGGALISGRL